VHRVVKTGAEGRGRENIPRVSPSIEQGWTSPPTQYIGYLGDSCTGQKTQPTVSKYWRKKRYPINASVTTAPAAIRW